MTLINAPNYFPKFIYTHMTTKIQKLPPPKISQLSDSVNDIVNNPKYTLGSPLGPMTDPGSKSLLIHLSQTLSNAFPEYDYSKVTPDHFEECGDAYIIKPLILY